MIILTSLRNLFAFSHSIEKQELQTFEKLKSCLENQQLDISKLLSICIDGSASKVGKISGNVAMVERFFGCSVLKYHCVIHQESLCGKVLSLQHVMVSCEECVKKIIARAENRSENTVSF